MTRADGADENRGRAGGGACTFRRVRIGVTGHRVFDQRDEAWAAVVELVRGWRRPIELWSSLAEGADRMVAEAVLAADPGARLVAVLPVPADDYRSDFADAASVAEFDRLLARADEVHVTGPVDDRIAAYERAGELIAEATELLVAVWDGEPARGPGGTADVVAYARDLGRRVAVIPVRRDVA